MNKLKELRKQTALGVAPSTIGMYEQGRREPDNEALIRIADYFGVTLDQLLDRETPIRPPGIGKKLERFLDLATDYLLARAELQKATCKEPTTLGERLSRARKKAGLTQAEVEQRTGINFKTISNWENNVSNPKPNEIVTLCHLYDISADDLLGVRRNKEATA